MQGNQLKTLTNLWDFALGTYDRPGVKTLLLTLQDEEGDDVVMCLALMASALAGCPLDPPRMARLREAVLPWQRGVTAPLRAARRNAASAHEDALKTQILDAELAAERVALSRAEEVIAPLGPVRQSADATAAARAHYRLYRAQDGRIPGESNCDLFDRLVEVVFAAEP